MDFNSILTLLAIGLAAYTIIPKSYKYELSVRLSLLDYIVISLTVLLVHYLLFYQSFRILNLNLGLGLYKYSLTPQNISYVILLFASIFLISRIYLSKVKPSNIKKYKKLIDHLLIESKYEELADIIDRNNEEIYKVFMYDSYLYRKKKLISNDNIYESIVALKGEYKPISKAKKVFFKILLSLFPDPFPRQKAAEEILYRLLASKEYLIFLSTNKPNTALKILGNKGLFTEELTNIFFRTQISTPNSQLYNEVYNNQNISSYSLYRIEPFNSILKFLFDDASVAERLAVWQPIGEALLSKLDDLFDDSQNDNYNKALKDYDEKGRWESQLFVSIRFFDIMVSCALSQNIQWHMWLFYFHYFVQKIERNYNPSDPQIENDLEFPTRYDFLLYSIFDAQCDWLRDIEDLNCDQANISFTHFNFEFENQSIAKSTILSLSECLKIVILSERITEKQKKSVLHQIFSTYFHLVKVSKTNSFAKLLAGSIYKGGILSNTNITLYRKKILEYYDGYDKIPHSNYTKDFEEYLKNGVPKLNRV